MYNPTMTGEIISPYSGKALKPVKLSNGYCFVTLCINGKRSQKLIHRLVAEAFIPNPNNLPEVNHKDCDKTNNHVDNLEWCTSKQNKSHAVQHGLYGKYGGEKHHLAKLNDAQVIEIRKLRGKMLGKEIAQLYGISKTQVSHILNNKKRIKIYNYE